MDHNDIKVNAGIGLPRWAVDRLRYHSKRTGQSIAALVTPYIVQALDDLDQEEAGNA